MCRNQQQLKKRESFPSLFHFALCVVALSWLFSPTAHANKSGVSPNVLSLPKGPGSLGGIGENVRANLNMGLMTYPIKIQLPKGRQSFMPTIGVSYSSSAGAGVMGIGWNLATGGMIQRLTVRGLPTYTNKDAFYGIGGEIVKVPGGPFYRERYEGSFIRYRWHQSSSSDQKGYWTAEHPDGSVSYYGGTHKGKVDTDSQVYGSKGTFRWALQARVDRNGNRIEYHYFREGLQLYLSKIEWVFNKSGQALYSTTLKYEDRPDPISDCKPGFDLKTTKRLKEITVFAQGKRVRSMSFTFDSASGLSRLIKVSKFGMDASKKHPVEFTIKYSEATFSEKTSRMVKIPTSVGQNFKAGNSDLLDVNGDGLPDVVDTTGSVHRFHINVLTLDSNLQQKTHDFPKSAVKDNPKALSVQLSNPSVQLLDYNGDGFTDMVDAVNKKIYINKGHSQWENQSAALASFPNMGKDPNLRFFDYNGDKKTDIITSSRDTTNYYVNDGKGSWKLQKSPEKLGVSFSLDKIRLIDLNGDGLSDAVQVLDGKIRYKKYLGYGSWSSWITINIPGLAQKQLGDKPQFRDINGDGLADMVAFVGSSIIYFVNKNGAEFSQGKSLAKFKGLDIPDSSEMSIRIADMNGNGSRDIVWFDNSGKITYLELFSERPNLLKEISNGIGQRINVEYGSSVHHYLRDMTCDTKKDKACAGSWSNKMPMAFTVVNRITTWASRSDKPASQATPSTAEKPQVQSIYYHHGFYDGMEKKFRGFSHVETLFDGDASVSARKDTIKYNVGATDPYLHGKLLEKTLSNGATHIYQKVTMQWKDCPVSLGGTDGKKLNPPIRFICMTSQETTHIEGESDQKKWRTTRTEQSYDGFGNVTLDANLGIKDKEGDEHYIQRTMITPKDPNDANAKWFLRADQRHLRCDKKPSDTVPCAETLFYYDGEAFKGLPNGEFTKGNLIRVRNRLNDGEDLWVESTRRKLDIYGNVIEYKDATGLLRKVTWDADFSRFPTSESFDINGLTLKMTTRWNTQLGAVVQSQGYNGQTVFYTYDTFGRITSKGNPGDSADAPSERYIYELKAPLSRIITEQRSKRGGSFDRKQIQCFDGMGRKLSTKSLLSGSKYLTTSQVEFNRLGQNARVWDNFEGSEACAFSAPKGVNFVEFHYDGLGRQVKKVNRDQTFYTTTFGPLQKKDYDPEDNDKNSKNYQTPTTYIMDGLGRTIQEIQMISKDTSLTTKYTYSAVNVAGKPELTSVTFNDGSQKKQSYNLLGLIVESTTPDAKTSTREYNVFAQLTKSTDARGKSTIFTYDALSRIKTMQEKGKADTLITYTYDQPQKEFPTATFLKGQLVKITHPGGTNLFSYNNRSQFIVKRYIFMGGTFDFKTEYHNMGQIISQTMPDGTKYEFKRDGADRLLSIPGKLQIEYNLNSTIKTLTAGNGVKTSYGYNKRNWMQSLSVNNGEIFKLDYTFDKTGNILALQQKHGSESFDNKYQYDGIYRLTQAHLLSGKEVLNYKTDALNNLLSKSSSLEDKSPAHVGALEYDATKTYRLEKTDKSDLKHDDAGNIISKSDLAMGWDYLSRCTEVKKDGKIVARSWFGHERRRIIHEENGVPTFYINNDFEIRDGVIRYYIRLGRDRLIAVQSPKAAVSFFDDLAPSGKSDGSIRASDAYLYNQAFHGKTKATLKKRPLKVDMTRAMLRSSLFKMLHGEKEVTHYMHADHLGSIRAVTNEKGQVIARKHYYPFGKVRSQQGGIFSHGYMGSEFNASTQTNRFRVRSQDPTLGRWWNPDPTFQQIKGTKDEFNTYGMVLNNPIRLREIEGNSAEDTISGIPEVAKIAAIATAGTVALGASSYFFYKANKQQSAEVAGNTRTFRNVLAFAKSTGQMLNVASTAGMLYPEMDKEARILSLTGSLIGAVRQVMSIQYQRNQSRHMLTGGRTTSRFTTAGQVLATAFSAVGLGASAAAMANHDIPIYVSAPIAVSSSILSLSISQYFSKNVKTVSKQRSATTLNVHAATSQGSAGAFGRLSGARGSTGSAAKPATPKGKVR